MSVGDWLTLIFCFVGSGFFLGGTLGLLRFPDVLSRLHALTKADNLGLGFIILGLAFQAGSLAIVLKLFLIWGIALLAGSSACYAIGRYVRTDRGPEREGGDGAS